MRKELSLTEKHKQIFSIIDQDNNGTVDKQEFIDYLQELQLEVKKFVLDRTPCVLK